MPKKKVIKKSALTPTVLIAGGAGFIGSHLAEMLLEQDARVIVLDNLKKGQDVHVNSLLDNPKFALFDVDINKGLPKEIESVDYIFHLTGVETYLYSTTDISLDSLLTNSIGTKNLLDLAIKSEAKFLLVSSIDVYQGMISSVNLEHYFGQTDQEERQFSLNEAKRYAEALVWEYFKKYKADVRIVRIPEVYGPRMDLLSHGELGRFLKDILEDKDLTLYGEGTEKHYYLHVSDIVSGFIKALFNEETKGKIYSLVGKEPYTTLEALYLVKGLANRQVTIDFKPRGKGLVITARTPDTTNLKDLKWEPKVPFKEGVAKTLEWFGYQTNEHSFKPNQMVQQKAASKVEEKPKKVEEVKQEETESIMSLHDISDSLDTKEPQQFSRANLATVIEPSSDSYNTIKPDLETASDTGFTVKQEAYTPATIADETQKAPKKTKNNPFPKMLAKIASVPATFVGLFSSVKIPEKLVPELPQEEHEVQKAKIVVSALTGFLLALTIFVGIPAVQAAVHANKAKEHLETVPNLLVELKIDEAKDTSNKAFQEMYKTQLALKRLKWAFVVTGKTEEYSTIQGLFGSGRYFSKTMYNLAKAAQPFSAFWEVIRPDSEVVLEEDQIADSTLFLSNAKSDLQLAIGEFKEVNVSLLPKDKQAMATEFGQALDQANEGLDIAGALAADLPNLMGINEPRKYLILFQNSNEIRATGGFIGSYAVLEIEKGKISNLTIDDIYNPDGQIDLRSISVNPPAPIQEYLEEPTLHIRNANWNPDFEESVKDIEDLFFKVDGSKFDGVVAVDLYFAQNLLRVTGPIFLTAYNEEITAENLYEKAQFHSEFNYENGSDQKKTFLTLLGSKLLEKLFSLEQEKIPHLVDEMQNALAQKHVLMSLKNSQFNAVLAQKNWNGSLVHNEDTKDYLYVVNSNVGGTKANYYVENSMAYGVTSLTRDGLLRGELKLTYNHTGEDYAWPGGPYKNYVRVLTQSGSKLTGATLVRADGETDIFEEMVISREGPYNSFETVIEVLPQEKVDLVIKYDLPQELSITGDNKEYALYWQKQPGTSGDDIRFVFSPPFSLGVVETVPETTNQNGSVEYMDTLQTDKQIYLKLE